MPMIGVWHDGNTLVLRLYIQPRSGRDHIVGAHGNEIKVIIMAQPVDGHLIRFLTKEFGVVKSRVILEKGNCGAINRSGSISSVKFPSPLHVYWTLLEPINHCPWHTTPRAIITDQPMQKVVLTTDNAGKVHDLAGALSDVGMTIVAQSALSVASVEETGLTFIENALIKARHATLVTGLPAIADDSGLAVDVLAGALGIYSTRYAGEDASDRQNVDKLLAALASVPNGQRGAHFHCVLIYLRNADDLIPLVCHGSWSGEIARQPSGAGGFGYDPVFLLPEQGRTAADLNAEEKQALSYCGQALACLLDVMCHA